MALLLGLSGCGADTPDEPSTGPSTTAAGTTASPTPSATPSATPTVEVADGPWLATKYNRIRLPKGATIEDNFGFESIKQAKLPDLGGIVHMVVHDGSGLYTIDDAATATKKDHEERLKVQADLQREDDVTLGDATPGFHLSGAEKIHTVDVYGTLNRGARYTVTVWVNDQFTPERRQEILDSMLPTWEFLSP